MVEISRCAAQMEEILQNSSASLDLAMLVKDCTYIKRIIPCEDTESIVANSAYDYCIKAVAGDVYRFEYDESAAGGKSYRWIVNIVLGSAFFLILGTLIYLYRKIIRPFAKLESIPYELSKGNLALHMPEEKEKYFGKFVWGTNMLRENIEERRQKELNLHREKKLLLLSLTHDIKTPLSVIRLNAQALERGLYKEEDRKQEALLAIRGKVDEIERYVSEITKASQEDFLELSVKEEEFYLSKVIKQIQDYYKDKLELNKTRFQVEAYTDCLLLGDENRLVEVLQNLFENAIKYGDGEEIILRFGQEEDCKLITVENTGTGMDQEELLKIFDSFFRGANAGAKSGSGLGLYICRQLMRGMRGDIFAKQKENCFQVTAVVRMCGGN